MTKEELIGLIKLNLGNTGGLHGNQIHLNIAMAWEQMLFAVYSRSPQGLDRYAIRYENIAIVKDERSGQMYSELPITPLRFVDIGEGLRRVVKSKQRSSETAANGDDIIFVPMRPQQTQLIANSDGGMISDVVGFYITDDRLWYFRAPDDIPYVDMDIVPAFDKLDYDQELAVPAGGVQLLVGITQEILKGVPFVDPRLRKINIQEI